MISGLQHKNGNNFQITVMPKKFGSYKAPTEWADAVRIAGSEKALCAGIKKDTWENWRRDNKVPAYRITKLLSEGKESEPAHANLVLLPPPCPEKIKEECVTMLNDMVAKGRVQSLGAIEQLLRAMSQGRSGAKRKRA